MYNLMKYLLNKMNVLLNVLCRMYKDYIYLSFQTGFGLYV